MSTTTLAEAVGTFARAAIRLPDAKLEQENWRWRAYEGVRMAFLQSYLELRELATIIATERSMHGPAMSSAQRILAQHHLAYRTLVGLVVGVGKDEADCIPAEGEWSLRSVLPHIIDTERGFHALIDYAVERRRNNDDRPVEMSEEMALSVYHLDDEPFYQASFEGMLAFYDEFHQRVLRDFAGIREEELNAPSLWWEEEEIEIRFRMHRFDAHLREHSIQVEKTLEGIGHHVTEVERLLWLIYEALGEVEGVLIGAWDSKAEQQRALAETITTRAHEIEGV